MNNELIFLKIGGSLITDKRREKTALPQRIENSAKDIVEARKQNPEIKLILGHGSGSYGHFAAKKHGTRNGVSTEKEWLGFADVWASAQELHRIVIAIFSEQGLPVISFPPSASVISQKGNIDVWNTDPIQAALEAKLIPVVFGDVAFDRSQGGAVLSTEEIFLFLSRKFKPQRILLAADEAVYSDYPTNSALLREIGSENFSEFSAKLSGGEGSDITGGMLSKVEDAMQMAKIIGRSHGNSSVRIFSGKEAGFIKKALMGESIGTLVSA